MRLRLGKRRAEIGDQRGELLEIAAAAALGFAGETGHAARHVGLEADALLLAVVADVDAGFGLLCDDVAHRAIHLLGRVARSSERLALFAVNQQFGKRFVARKAADVGGEDAVAAE